MFRRTLIFGALTLGAVILSPAARVFAHSDYDSSTPGKSESVPQAPARLDLYTTQDLFRQEGENEIQVLSEAEARVDDGTTDVDDDNRRHMSVGLQPNLPPGRYTVRWKTFSAEDDERFESGFAFYVGVSPTAAQLAQDQEFQVTIEEQFEAQQPTAEESATGALPSGEETPAATPVSTAVDDTDDDGGGTSAGVVVGAIAAAVALAVVVVGGGWYMIRRGQG